MRIFWAPVFLARGAWSTVSYLWMGTYCNNGAWGILVIPTRNLASVKQSSCVMATSQSWWPGGAEGEGHSSDDLLPQSDDLSDLTDWMWWPRLVYFHKEMFLLLAQCLCDNFQRFWVVVFAGLFLIIFQQLMCFPWGSRSIDIHMNICWKLKPENTLFLMIWLASNN